jgi:hypothetical protein
MVDERMSSTGDITDRKKADKLGDKFLHSHFTHQKRHMDFPAINASLLGQNSANLLATARFQAND